LAALLSLFLVASENRGRQYGLSSAGLAGFFDQFSSGGAMTPGGDLGLGPPVAHRILSLFGAPVAVANLDPAGIRLTVSIENATPDGGDSRTN